MRRLKKPVVVGQQKNNRSEFQRMRDEEISLYDFVRNGWHVIEQSKKFVDGKHIKAICDHLEALVKGMITRVVVNMPPRFAKSSIISVLFRVWVWIKYPWVRFLCASYKLSLAIRDNQKCRRLIQSKWFQDLYGHIFKLSKSQNAKIKFENDHLGSSEAVSVGSSATGEGFDIGLIDDPHSIDEKRSDVTREGTLEWFKDTWCTRLNDPLTSAMIVVGQRVHAEDLSGYILSGETGENWVHLNLATEFEPSDRCITYTNDGKELWRDWRAIEGELLWEERFPKEVIERAKRRHGPLAYAALYQQRPVPAGGLIFKSENERYFTIDHEAGAYLLETPRGVKAVSIADCWHATTSDVAAKEKEQNDWTAFANWAITPTLDVLLLDVHRGHWTIPEQEEQGYKIFLTFNNGTYQGFYFEDVGYQSAIGQNLALKGVPCLPFSVAGKGDKVLRAGAASIWQQLGKVYWLKFAYWLVAWRKELYGFPKDPNDDQVDTFSQICLIIRKPRPGVYDESDAAKIDTTLSIEQILDADAIAKEQAGQEAKQQEEARNNPSQSIDPFEWASSGREGGWDW